MKMLMIISVGLMFASCSSIKTEKEEKECNKLIQNLTKDPDNITKDHVEFLKDKCMKYYEK